MKWWLPGWVVIRPELWNSSRGRSSHVSGIWQQQKILCVRKHNELFFRQKALPSLIHGYRFGLNDRICPLLNL